MKKYQFLLLSFVLAFCSCKDPIVPDPTLQVPSSHSLILGLWSAERTEYRVYDSNGNLLNELKEDVTDVNYEFFQDSSFLATRPGQAAYHGKWKVKEPDTIFIDGYPYGIDILNDTVLRYHSSFDTLLVNMVYSIETLIELKR